MLCYLQDVAFSLFLLFLLLEEEVDGKTLLKLSEGMVCRLLPTMKLQVKFIDLQTALTVGSQPSSSTHESVESPGLIVESLDVIRSSPSEQNGSVSYCISFTITVFRRGQMVKTIPPLKAYYNIV